MHLSKNPEPGHPVGGKRTNLAFACLLVWAILLMVAAYQLTTMVTGYILDKIKPIAIILASAIFVGFCAWLVYYRSSRKLLNQPAYKPAVLPRRSQSPE